MQLFKDFSRLLNKRAYLDYASSTPVDRRMYRTFPRIPRHILAANPNALHHEGVTLKRYLSQAHERVAQTLDVQADEIIFTSGATESDNLAIRGTIDQWMTDGIRPEELVIFSSELEHAAVAEAIEPYSRLGAQHNIVPINVASDEPTERGAVEAAGFIVPETARAVFITVMYVSNEIGTVQPIAEIAKRVRKLRKVRPDLTIVFHTDATQAASHLPLRVPTLGVDMMTLGATKLYCRKGVGVLFKKRSLKLQPMMRGGGQERGLRPGTEPVDLIHEFSYSLQYACDHREEYAIKVEALQKEFEIMLKVLRKHQMSGTVKDRENGQENTLAITGEKLPRSPHITHVGMRATAGIADSELLVIELDARGVAVSAKSACKNEEGNESPIVERMYGPHHIAIRFSFGRMTTKRDLRKAVTALGFIFEKYRP